MKPMYALLIAVFFFLPSTEARERTAISSLVLPEIQKDHPYDRIAALFAALPDGTELGPDQFVQTLGADANGYLTLFGVTKITSHKDVISVDLARALDMVTKKGTKLQVENHFSFTVQRQASGKILCTEVSGIRVKSFWFAILGWMPMHSLSIQRTIKSDGDHGITRYDNTSIKAQFSSRIGLVERGAELDIDGKVLE